MCSNCATAEEERHHSTAAATSSSSSKQFMKQSHECTLVLAAEGHGYAKSDTLMWLRDVGMHKVAARAM